MSSQANLAPFRSSVICQLVWRYLSIDPVLSINWSGVIGQLFILVDDMQHQVSGFVSGRSRCGETWGMGVPYNFPG